MLVAPLHLRGDYFRRSRALAAERADWICRHALYYSSADIAEALDTSRGAVRNVVWRWRKGKPRKVRPSVGLQFGWVGPAVNRMPWPALDALEAHCARTGLTMAEALADAWVERVEAGR